MSARLYLPILLLPFFMSGQVQFQDDFNDGDFTSNPPWKALRGIFEISSDKRLQLKDTIAGEAQLYTASTITHEAEWNFFAELKFNPSSSNYAEVYLCADSSDFQQAPNAVFVRIGGSTSDRVSLFVRQAGRDISLLESASGLVGASNNRLAVRLKRSAGNLWELFVDTSAALAGYTSLGTATYNPVLYSKYTGVRCVYTITRAQKMFFDNFSYSGVFVKDTIPPKVEDLVLEDNKTLRIRFNEPLNSASVDHLGNFELINVVNQITDAKLDIQNRRQVLVQISPALNERVNYKLKIKQLRDKEGNVMRDTSLVFADFTPQRGDLVFNELLPDPTPVVGVFPNALPEGEYIELYNPESFDINLIGWRLSVGSKLFELSRKLVPADSFVLLARQDIQAYLPAQSNFLPVPLSNTELTNSGSLLRLYAPNEVLVDEIGYDESWYGDVVKAEGGWSLERIDATNLCGGAENWKACSNAIGGTPGWQNSVVGQTFDTIAPRVSRFSVDGDSVVYVHLSEWVDDPFLRDTSGYRISPVLKLKLIRANHLERHLEFVLADRMQPGEQYVLEYLGNSADCAGNPLLFEPGVIGVAQAAEKGGVLLNEVLFNPKSGGVDYVELYNSSESLVDLQKLRLANYVPGTNILDEVKVITDKSYLLPPGGYVCLSERPIGVSGFYQIKAPEALFEASDLPTLPDDAGSVALLNANLTVVDSFVYASTLHSPVLLDEEGVSLERACTGLGISVEACWYSATSTAGFGTPGYANSQQQSNKPASEHKLDLVYTVFSPNNDGYRDKLDVGYAFDKTNYVVSISVYNKEGYEVKKLSEAQLVSRTGMLVWDGTDAYGKVLKRDAYVLVLEYFHPDGESGFEKQAVVLTY